MGFRATLNFQKVKVARYRHMLKTINTHFKFFAISISWAKTTLFSLWTLHLFTPSSLMAKVSPQTFFF